MAQEMGVRPGEEMRITVNLSVLPMPVRVAGLWRAAASDDPFWFSNPDQNFKNTFLVRRLDYLRFVEPMFPAKAGSVSWSIALDDAALNPANARHYVEGYKVGMNIINQFLPGAKLDLSATDRLEQFVLRQSTLTVTLLSFHLPALGFLAAFLILLALIISDWQRRETAILISRGMRPGSILTLAVVEEFTLYALGTPLGILLGMQLARIMGDTIGFLNFSPYFAPHIAPHLALRAPLPVSVQGLDVRLVLIALGAALTARLVTTLQATRQSVVVQERERARPLRPPWWQRTWLDLLLVIPTLYAYQQLTQQGTIARLSDLQILSAFSNPSDDLLQNPLLVLFPALVIFCAGLLAMRLFTLLMKLLDLVARWTPTIAIHLALRQIGRHGHYVINPLLLTIVALAFGIYTYSLAASLDQWQIDRIYYSVGADVTFLPLLPSAEENATGDASESSDAVWTATHSEFAQLDGVLAAGRVGRYRAQIGSTPNDQVNGHFLGIDRVEFPSIAWFRRDFAPQSLGALMNLLALDDKNILVPRLYLQATGHRIGDMLPLVIGLAEELAIANEFKIVGVYDYFPTSYPDDLVVIGNLEYLFTLAGAAFPYSVWMRTDPAITNAAPPAATPTSDSLASPDVRRSSVLAQVEDMGFEISAPRDSHALVATAKSKYERVGILGTLSIGFLAATTMATLVLLVHSYASLQERLYQFGVLRALGLRKWQVLGQVILEYALLILFGALSGVGIGITTSQLFAPFFRITNAGESLLPPLLPIIPQEQINQLILAFVTLMVLIEALVLTRALSNRLFDTLRMGHQD
jgi:putative ABC transport system permease protein